MKPAAVPSQPVPGKTMSGELRHAVHGPCVCDAGVEYRIWAPMVDRIDAIILGADDKVLRTVPLQHIENGYFSGMDASGRAGDLYKFRLDGQRHCPDPASRWQPRGVHGPSMVINSATFRWTDEAWRSPEVRALVIYELHVGTFTPEGTFLSAMERLPHVRDLGVTAVELMPVGEFPGDRGWGYDGVYLYAPSRAYGAPDDLRRFVDAAHSLGIAVILDVVYNHFGPDGNYLGAYVGDYLDESQKTPWGGAIRYGDPAYHGLRAMVLANPQYWMDEFHIDGFRFDATHAIRDDSDPHILQELTREIHHRGGFAIAEDERRDPRLITAEAAGGLGFDAVWADDFHHSVRVAFTQERESYFAAFLGELQEQLEILECGWRVPNEKGGSPTGAPLPPTRGLRAEQFVHCISNHDQVGNRALGERLSGVVSPDCYRAASALLCLSPCTPLLFMGQEWAAATPFLFFTDHEPNLGKLVTEGRREEFRAFTAFQDSEARKRIPDPQAGKTFFSSKLRWDEIDVPVHSQILRLYRDCLALRKKEPAFATKSEEQWTITKLKCGAGALSIQNDGQRWMIVFDLTGANERCLLEVKEGQPHSASWDIMLCTSDLRYGGSGRQIYDAGSGSIHFTEPGLLVLRSARSEL